MRGGPAPAGGGVPGLWIPCTTGGSARLIHQPKVWGYTVLMRDTGRCAGSRPLGALYGGGVCMAELISGPPHKVASEAGGPASDRWTPHVEVATPI